MNPAYFETWFRYPVPPPWPAFALVTAHNPHGRIIPPAENDARAAALRARLTRAGLPWVAVDAGAADFSHCEASLAIACTLDEGLALARDEEQVALFWVEAGGLWLVDCASEARHYVAGWGARQAD